MTFGGVANEAASWASAIPVQGLSAAKAARLRTLDTGRANRRRRCAGRAATARRCRAAVDRTRPQPNGSRPIGHVPNISANDSLFSLAADPIIGIHAPTDKYMRADTNSIVSRLAPSTLSHLGKPQPRSCLHSYPDIMGALRFGALSHVRCFAFLAVYKLMAIP